MGYLDELLGYQQQSQISGKGKLQGNQVEAAFRGYIGAQETAAQNSRQLDLQNRQLALQQQAENSREGEFTQSQAQQQSEYTAGLASQQEIAAGQMSTGLQETAMGTASSEKNTALNAATSTANTLTATRSAEAIAANALEVQKSAQAAQQMQGYIQSGVSALGTVGTGALLYKIYGATPTPAAPVTPSYTPEPSDVSDLDAGFGSTSDTAIEGGAAEGTSLAAYATPLAYIGAAEAVKGALGGGNTSYADKTTTQRMADEPATEGMLTTLAPGALFADPDTLVGQAVQNLNAAESDVLSPINYVFGNKGSSGHGK